VRRAAAVRDAAGPAEAAAGAAGLAAYQGRKIIVGIRPGDLSVDLGFEHLSSGLGPEAALPRLAAERRPKFGCVLLG
jgi:hypothetical protein